MRLRPAPRLSPFHQSRQRRDKRDRVVGLSADFPNRSLWMLLMPLCRRLRVFLQRTASSWLPIAPTSRETQKRHCCIRSSPNNSKRSSPGKRSGTAPCPNSWNGNFVPFSTAGFWSGVFCDFVANPAVTIDYWHSHVIQSERISAAPTQRRKENSMNTGFRAVDESNH